jgi:propanediol dehydratase large subunit
VSVSGSGGNRWRRFVDWDERPLRLDRFAKEDPANGFSAMKSPKDPAPGVEIVNGRVVAMDGVAEADFDMIASSPPTTSIRSSPRKRWRCRRSNSRACSST